MERVTLYLSVQMDKDGILKLLANIGLPRGCWYRITEWSHGIKRDTVATMLTTKDGSGYMCTRFR